MNGNCPKCGTELRFGRTTEEKDRYVRQIVCPNRKCSEYKKVMDEAEIFKEAESQINR